MGGLDHPGGDSFRPWSPMMDERKPSGVGRMTLKVALLGAPIAQHMAGAAAAVLGYGANMCADNAQTTRGRARAPPTPRFIDQFVVLFGSSSGKSPAQGQLHWSARHTNRIRQANKRVRSAAVIRTFNQGVQGSSPWRPTRRCCYVAVSGRSRLREGLPTRSRPTRARMWSNSARIARPFSVFQPPLRVHRLTDARSQQAKRGKRGR